MPQDLDKIRQIKEAAEADLLKRPGVTGVDVGYKYVGGKKTDEIVVRVHVAEKKAVPPDQMIPATINGVKTDVLQNRFELAIDGTSYNPLRGGISIGQFPDPGVLTAGTLGAIVIDNASGAHMALSNFHVLPGKVGALVGQPGSLDGTQVVVGDVVRSHLGGQVDCAVASIGDLSAGGGVMVGRGFDYLYEIVDIGPVTGTAAPTWGMEVNKRGRTTGLTYGTIDGLSLTTAADYSAQGLGTVTLTNQIMIAADPTHNTQFADHGDSGSVVVNSAGQVIGLLCTKTDTGSGTANPIQSVLDQLNVSMAICGLEVEVHHQGGYVARCSVEYDLSGQHQSQSSGDFSAVWPQEANQEARYTRFLLVPPGATNIHVKCEDETGLVWEPWRTIFDETYPGPAQIGTRKTFTLTGTTLDPTYGEDAIIEISPSTGGKSSYLSAGAYLGVNDYLVSNNGQYFAIMQGDGNFVLYHGSGPSNQGPAYWASNTVRGQGQYFAVLQDDANFVIYQGSDPWHQGAFVWNSGVVSGQITVKNQGGYVARCSVDYGFGGQSQHESSGNFNVGQSYSVTIPAGASNIHVVCEDQTGLVWDPWKTILDTTYSTPPQKTITLTGTTLNPGSSGQ